MTDPSKLFLGFEEFLGGAIETYPPMNIIRVDDEVTMVEIGVAGFSESDINITEHSQKLIISGSTPHRPLDDDSNYLHRKLAFRPFSRSFRLAPHSSVESAELSDGVLTIIVRKQIPEELKPKSIEIKRPDQRQILKG